MRIVFMGTPQFACPSLRAVYDGGYEIAGVFTQPDRPKNRGKALTPPPVKALAESLGLPVYQYERIKTPEANEKLKALSPDLVITAAFGQILSAENLAVPPLGTVNVHASLLPKYRGAAPIEWCLLNGEEKTGVTTMYTDVGMDTGDMIIAREIAIEEDDTCGTLTVKLSRLGASTLMETLKLIEAGTAPRTPQDETEATYYPMLKREMALMDFTKSARDVINHVRAMNGSMGAYTLINGERVKVFAASRADMTGEAGICLASSPKTGLIVGCADGSVRLSVVQAPGKKPMADADLLRGRKIDVGARFGQ